MALVHPFDKQASHLVAMTLDCWLMLDSTRSESSLGPTGGSLANFLRPPSIASLAFVVIARTRVRFHMLYIVHLCHRHGLSLVE